MLSLGDIQRIEVQRREIQLEDYKMRSAVEADYDQFIDSSAFIYESGKLIVAYIELDNDCSKVVEALKTVEYRKDFRTDGLATNSKVFGFMPRNTIRRDFCTVSAMASESPDAHALVCAYGEDVCDQFYEAVNPVLYAEHKRQTETNVVGDFRIKQSVFTSGIINYNNPLKYHFDTGNFKDVWSNMLVFKHRVAGGFLSTPQFGLGFKLRHNSLFMFDGQSILHGVTPINRQSPDAFRYSVVYYSLRQMWNCEPLGAEVARIKKLKTEREKKRRDALLDKARPK